MDNNKIVKFILWLFIGIVVDAFIPVLSTVCDAAQQSARNNGFPQLYSYLLDAILIIGIVIILGIVHKYIWD
jgi:hypothetical protein